LMAAGALAIISAGIFWNNFNEADKINPVKIVKAASHQVPVKDYAWSDNIGWIQFNPSYGGVLYDTSTGQLSGYAWSDNIGWIKFNGLSASGGVGGTGAKADSPGSLTSTTVSGWARACAGMTDINCTDMTSRTDGWDGWIKFNNTGISNPVTIDLTNGEFHGYAWGSDVVGWISFSCKEGKFDSFGNKVSICPGDGEEVTSNYQVKAELSSVVTPNWFFDTGSGFPLSATTTAGLSATSTVATLSLNGQTAGNVYLSASAISGLPSAKVQFSKDNGVTWSNTATVDKLIGAPVSVKVRVINIPGGAVKGVYTATLTAQDLGLGGLEKKLYPTLSVNKVTYRWEEF